MSKEVNIALVCNTQKEFDDLLELMDEGYIVPKDSKVFYHKIHTPDDYLGKRFDYVVGDDANPLIKEVITICTVSTEKVGTWSESEVIKDGCLYYEDELVPDQFK